MDELIHQFLLQSGYPRAAIVTNVESVLGKVADPNPDLIVVDPESAEPLAVLTVLDARVDENLTGRARSTEAAARALRGSVQGYVIRIDADGETEHEQLQFYRVGGDGTLQQLSARTFPDIDSLRVAQRLMNRRRHPDIAATPDTGDVTTLRLLAGLTTYVWAVVLGLLAIGDIALRHALGLSILALPDSVLLLASAVLLSLPVATQRRTSS